MTRQRSRALLTGLVLAACATPLEPVDPVWGKQACDGCHMLISDPFYAAELIDAKGQRHFFDDIGCLVTYVTEHEGVPRGMWVRAGSRWIAADSARYTSGASSPMAYGFAAQEFGPLDFAAVRRGAAAHRTEPSR